MTPKLLLRLPSPRAPGSVLNSKARQTCGAPMSSPEEAPPLPPSLPAAAGLAGHHSRALRSRSRVVLEALRRQRLVFQLLLVGRAAGVQSSEYLIDLRVIKPSLSRDCVNPARFIAQRPLNYLLPGQACSYLPVLATTPPL